MNKTIETPDMSGFLIILSIFCSFVLAQLFIFYINIFLLIYRRNQESPDGCQVEVEWRNRRGDKGTVKFYNSLKSFS